MTLPIETTSNFMARSLGTDAIDGFDLQTAQSHANTNFASKRVDQAQYFQMSNDTQGHQTDRWFVQLAHWAADNWAWEIGSWVFSTILLGLIIVVLLIHNNQPLPDWPLGTNINAIISLLSILSTSALLLIVTSIIGQDKWSQVATKPHRLSEFGRYDEASRGPLGSLALLLSTRKWNGATLGAIIVVASMANGPFLQQITAISSTEVTTGDTFLYARTEYPNLDNVPLSQRISSPLSYYIVPDVMTASIYRGVYRDESLDSDQTRDALQNQPICPTGNCTYDDFDSLAVCSACANITGFLKPPADVTNAWTWTLPNNFTTSVSTNFFPNTALLVSTGGSSKPLLLQAGLPIANITAIQPCVDGNGASCAATAQECMLYWCVNRYQSKVIGGVLQEKVIESIRYGYTIDSNLPENDTYVFQVNSTTVPRKFEGNHASDNFTVSKWGSASLTDKIAAMLTLDVDLAFPASSDIYHGIEPLHSTFPGVPLNMTPFFDAMATSMTSSVRSGGIDTKGVHTIPGKILREVPYLRVRWVWICLPIILQSAVLILLCYTAVSTSRQKLPVWKNSIFTTIVFGARIHHSLPKMMPSDKLSDVKTAVEDVKVDRDQIFAARDSPDLAFSRNF